MRARQGVFSLLSWLVAVSLAYVAIHLTGCEQAQNPHTPPSTPSAPALPSLGYLTDLEQARLQARTEGKPILVFFTAEWCKYCHQLADEVLCQGQIRSLTNQFVCVELDCDQFPRICQQYRVGSYPTLLLLNPQGHEIGRLVGFQPFGQVSGTLQLALQSLARAQRVQLRR
ncbi:MAG: thioredoxin family protein [Pirellulales bacterium]|nr:thioredoxin family protein [Pirellulales bacterium]